MAEKPEEKKLLTRSGYNKLDEELQFLKTVKRKEIAEKIREAREQGDLSENAEYDAARDEQVKIEARIEELDNYLKNVEIQEEGDINIDKVGLACTVTLLNLNTNKEVVYKLVGANEVNSRKGKISNESPIGAAIIGQSIAAQVSVETPAGPVVFEILNIERTIEED